MSYGSAALKLAAPVIAGTIAVCALTGIFRTVNKFVDEADVSATAASANCVHEKDKQNPKLESFDCVKK